MTVRGTGSKQRDIVEILTTHGPTLPGPAIYSLVAELNGRSDVTDSLKKQLRKSLDALCRSDASGNPPMLSKQRKGGANYFTLIKHALTQQQISAEDRQLGAAYRAEAPERLLEDPQAAQREFLTSVALQTWKRVKCLAGEVVDANQSIENPANYIMARLGFSPDDLNQYIRSEATRIARGSEWQPLTLVR